MLFYQCQYFLIVMLLMGYVNQTVCLCLGDLDVLTLFT